MSTELTLFNMDFTLPADGDKIRYARNCQTAILTTTAARAIEVLIENHPTAIVHGVHRASRGSVLFDKNLT